MSKISIIGRGIDPTKHLSLSAIKALQNADRVLGIESEKEFWNGLCHEFEIPVIEDVANFYSSQDTDLNNYNRFVEYIIDLASKNLHLALLVAGHPTVGVTFIDILRKKAPRDLEIEIIEGISSFDVMISYLGFDPLEHGSVLLDANRLLLFRYVIEPSLSYFIYHISSVGNSITNYLNPGKGNRLDILKNYLLKFYSANKEIFLCRMSNGSNEDSIMTASTILNLESCAEKMDYVTTLFIPGEKPKHMDWEYLSLLR